MHSELMGTEPEGRTVAAVKERIDAGGVDVVVYLGGDGTFAEVAKGILAARTALPLGMLPSGTANDQGLSFGIARGDIARNVAGDAAVVNSSDRYALIDRFSDISKILLQRLSRKRRSCETNSIAPWKSPSALISISLVSRSRWFSNNVMNPRPRSVDVDNGRPVSGSRRS